MGNTSETAARSAAERRCPRCHRAGAIGKEDGMAFCRHALADPPRCNYVVPLDVFLAEREQAAKTLEVES